MADVRSRDEHVTFGRVLEAFSSMDSPAYLRFQSCTLTTSMFVQSIGHQPCYTRYVGRVASDPPGHIVQVAVTRPIPTHIQSALLGRATAAQSSLLCFSQVIRRCRREPV